MNEFPYTIQVDKIKSDAQTFEFEASEEQCQALAQRYGILGIKSLKVQIDVKRQNAVVILAKGQFEAIVIQECVVSLDPVETLLKEDVEGFFTDRDDTVSFAKIKHKHIQENHDPETSFLDEEDDPEKVIDGQIDLGELVAQHLSLSLPAYPRKEGVVYDKGDENVSSGEGDTKDKKRHNPFAALEALKKDTK